MADERVKKPFYKRWWFWLIVIIIIIAIATSGGDDETNQTNVNNNTENQTTDTNDNNTATEENNQENAENNEPAQEEPKEPEVTTIDAGMYEVPKDVKPGIYYNPDGGAYVARLKGFSGNVEDIIANANPMGPWYIEVKSTDAGVQFQEGGWRLFDDTEKARHELKTTIEGDGIYLVGVDIEPGKYKLDGSSAYWARLKDVSNDLSAIIANGNPTGPTIVTIAPTDYAFQVTGGGTWTKSE